MKRWIAGIAAVGLIVGIGGPVAAKVGTSSKAPRPAKISAPVAKPERPSTNPAPTGLAILPYDHNSGSYPGPNQPMVEVDPSNPRRGRDFKVEVKYFCRRGSVSVDIAPSVAGWPKTITTDRYGKGYVKVNGGLSTPGNYTLTATCGADTATTSFRVK